MVVSEDMEMYVYMSAMKAQAYGLVDLVALENRGISRKFTIPF